MHQIRFFRNVIVHLIFSHFLVCRVLPHILVLVSACKIPEFRGLEPNHFPEQPLPRQLKIEPRRIDLPAGFENDWKKINSRRSKAVMIYVTPAE